MLLEFADPSRTQSARSTTGLYTPTSLQDVNGGGGHEDPEVVGLARSWLVGRLSLAAGDGKATSSVGSTVDLETATYLNTIGDAHLTVGWTDPDFDPDVPCFYYVRVLEIPTPRWTAFDELRFGIKMDAEVTRVLQERAYSSPIWYTPGN